MQANVRWFQRNKAKEHINVAVESLHILWKSKNQAEFVENLLYFKSMWRSICQPYLYFESQWLKARPPVEWAAYGRSSSMPSGDNISEAWHNRLKRSTSRRKMTVNEMLLWLSEEAKFFYTLHEDESIRSPYLHEQEITKRYARNISLKNYTPANHYFRVEEIFGEEEDNDEPSTDTIPVIETSTKGNKC